MVHLSQWLQTFAMSFRREESINILLPKYSDYNLTKTFEFDAWVQHWMTDHYEYSASSCQERAFTFGFYSYHIGGERHPGTLAERVEHIRQAMQDPRNLGGGYAKDFLPYREPGPWTELQKRSSLGQRSI